jgi:hypothetical protein
VLTLIHTTNVTKPTETSVVDIVKTLLQLVGLQLVRLLLEHTRPKLFAHEFDVVYLTVCWFVCAADVVSESFSTEYARRD